MLALSALVACHGIDAPRPSAPADAPHEVPSFLPRPEEPLARPGPPTAPAAVDVVSFAADELPSQPLGRVLRVALSEPAAASVTCALVDDPPAWRQLVPLRARWRYLDDGTDPGAAWSAPSFDDTTWPEGEAPFTVLMPGGTTLATGVDGPAETTRFRTTFVVDDPARVTRLRLELRRDDGVVVFLGGTEVLRDNVPVVRQVHGTEEIQLEAHDLPLVPGLLTAGENTIAVELHQVPGSADAAFHLRLSALVDGDPEPEVHLAEDPTASTDHAMPLYGLLPGATYDCVARATEPGGRTASSTIVTAPLEGPIPELALHPEHPTPSWGAYTLINHQRPCGDDGTSRLLIVDPEGRPRWVHGLDLSGRSTIDIEAATVGSDAILWAGGEEPAGSPHLVGLDGEDRYVTTYPGAEEDIYHHDVERSADGRILGIANHGDDGVTRPGFDLVEHDPATGQVTWRWSAADALARGQLDPGAPGDMDPWHPNALTSVDDADGQGVEVALFYADRIVRVDRATGDVQWQLGKDLDFRLVGTDGAELPPDQWFDHVHGLNRYGDLLYMYDNGWARGQSRAIALRLDTAAHTATLAWSWTEPGWYEKRWGDVDELPNGTVLVAMARTCTPTDHPGALVEVDPVTGDVPWRLDFLDLQDSMYRAQRIDGCAMFANSRWCPEVARRVAELEAD